MSFADDYPDRESDEVLLCGTLKRETGKAYLISFAEDETLCWIPKSLIDFHQEGGFSLDSYFTVPLWFVEKEGLDLYIAENL